MKRHPNANGTQDLLTQGAEKSLPALYSQDSKGDDAICYVKFFLANYTWYATEYDPETGNFFGLVDGDFVELGYFNLQELQALKVRGMFAVERDIHWKPTPLKDIRPNCTGQ